MKRIEFIVVFSIFGLLVGGSTARASGFAINENSARIMGMAGAFVGIADSPGTIFNNPAGLAQLDGLNIELGMTLVMPGASWSGTAPSTGSEVDVDAKKHLFPLPSLHASYRVHDRVAVGLGVYLPFGLTMEWPDQVDVGGADVDWWGRSIVRKIALRTLFVTPTVAVKLHRRVLMGLGFNIVAGDVTLERAVTFSANAADDVDFKMSGDDVSFGATAGLLVKVLPDLLNLGVSYRSGVNFTFQGNAVFTKDGEGKNVPVSLRDTLIDGPGSATLNLPHVISVGLAAFPTPALRVGLTVDVNTWSAYDKLEIKFADLTDESGIVTQRRSQLNTSEPKHWRNTVTVRLGAEYEVLTNNLPVRLGFIFDQNPVPESTIGPELPDGNRYEFTAGVGYTMWGITADLAYQYLFSEKIKATDTSPLPGTYQADAHLVALSLAYNLDI